MNTTTSSRALITPLDQTWAQLRLHAVHLLLVPPMALVGVTFLHELAHAAMVWALGGTVTAFSVLPGEGSLGHIQYLLPDPALSPLVAAGPTLLWAGLMALTAGLSLWRWPPVVGAGLFWWGYAVPLGDILWHAVPYLSARGENDLNHAMGPPTLDVCLFWCVCLLGAFGLGTVAFWRLYGAHRPPGWMLLCAGALSALVALVTFGL